MTYEWVWDGGRPCLDLVNTLRDRKQEPYELLREPADLATWLTAAGLLEVTPAITRAEVADSRQLREAIDGAVQAVVHEGPVPRGSVDVVNTWASQVPAPQLELSDGQLRPVRPQHAVDALALIAADAVDLLTSDDVRLVRVCGSSTCGLRFLDRSRGRKRQWCSMARCGNREKARQHYARVKSSRRPGIA